MKRRPLVVLLAMLPLLSTSIHAQQVSLLGGRVAAMDPPALGEFYESVFGMFEVNRFVFEDGGIEVMLNFGATEAEAKANTGPQVVLFPRPSDDVEDNIPHLIFSVPDIRAAMTAVLAAGGSLITEEPIVIPDGGSQITIALALDPVGNQLEMIELP